MNLKEIRRAGDEVMITPVERRDIPLFRHCANGCEAVSETTFNNEVSFLLERHGIDEFWTKKLLSKQKARPSEISLDWIKIPSGTLTMGSAYDDPEAFGDEKPAHEVELKAFQIAKTPVTNAQYQLFVRAADHRAPNHWKNGEIPEGKGNHPVINVSWYDATAYCEWLSETTSKKVCLPTEAQWEYAARGVEGRKYPWGKDEPTKALCNFDMDIGGETPVGNYPAGATPEGAEDMAGNVWEWCQTKWRDDCTTPADEDHKDNGARVLRGGSFSSSQRRVRAACRHGCYPNFRYDSVGFRVAASP